MESIFRKMSRPAVTMLWLTAAYMMFDVMDSITTAIGGSIGLAETNPYGVVFLEINPMMFYVGSTMYCLATGLMLVLIVQFHPRLYKPMKCLMIALMLVKAHPVLYNMYQIMIRIGWIN